MRWLETEEGNHQEGCTRAPDQGGAQDTGARQGKYQKLQMAKGTFTEKARRFKREDITHNHGEGHGDIVRAPSTDFRGLTTGQASAPFRPCS